MCAVRKRKDNRPENDVNIELLDEMEFSLFFVIHNVVSNLLFGLVLCCHSNDLSVCTSEWDVYFFLQLK